jgi:hypothetical protein
MREREEKERMVGKRGRERDRWRSKYTERR